MTAGTIAALSFLRNQTFRYSDNHRGSAAQWNAAPSLAGVVATAHTGRVCSHVSHVLSVWPNVVLPTNLGGGCTTVALPLSETFRENPIAAVSEDMLKWTACACLFGLDVDVTGRAG